MAGTNYERQSTFSDGDVITAGLFNNEFNQVLNAFAYSATGTTGHQHDGGAGEGGNIEIIGDGDFLNKILVDGTNNRWGFYVQVGASTAEQIRIQDGAIVPVTDNDIDLGTSSLQFKDAYINGTLEADAITVAGITLSETIADTVGAMATSNTETGITVTYNDADNTLDFVIGAGAIVSSMLETNVTVAGNIIVGGTVDGRDVATDGTKLDGIEASATADQTNAEIRAAVEAASDSNVFTDADHTKLNSIETGADVVSTASVTAVGALMDSELTALASVKAINQGLATTDSPTFVDLTVSGDDITMGTNTADAFLIADGTNFSPTTIGSLSELTSIAGDDVFLAIDTSGGGLKKVARSTVVQGLAASNAIANVVEDTTPQLGGDLDSQGKDITDVGILSADTVGGIYGSSSSPVVFTVTVASKTSAHPYNGDGSSSAYFLNGVESPAIQFSGVDGITSSTGYYYKFDQADSSNSGHPLLFYYDAAKTTAYTTGVTTSGTPGSSGAHTTIAVTSDTPNILYYECSSHSYMGNYATAVTTTIGTTGAVKIPVGTTAQRPTAVAGQLRYNSTTGEFEGYTDAWGSVGGLVTTARIANDAVTLDKMAANSVDSDQYVDGSIDLIHMSANSVDSDQYVDGSIDLIHMSANSVDSDQYVDGSIDTAHIADGQVTVAKMAANSVDSDQYVDGSIDLIHMSANSVDSDQYVDGSIDLAHMSVNSVGSDQYVDGSINTAHIADGQVTLAKMAANSVDSDQYVDGSIDTAHIADNAIVAAAITDGTITAAKLGTGVGGAFNNFLVKTANYTAVTRDQLVVNSGSAVTITLPASPTAGNIVFIENAGAGTVTVARNGSNINSTADDGELATDAGATLVYVDSTIGWKEL